MIISIQFSFPFMETCTLTILFANFRKAQEHLFSKVALDLKPLPREKAAASSFYGENTCEAASIQ